MGEPDSNNSPTIDTYYQYNALNNLTRIDQWGGSAYGSGVGDLVRMFSYDSLSRLFGSSNPETGNTSYGYDANGNVITKTDARGITTTFAYDTLNRLTAKTYSDTTPPAHFNYDESTITVGNNFWSGPHALTNTVGRMSSWYVGTSEPGLAMKSFSYDAMGRPIQSWQCWGTSECNAAYGTRQNHRIYDLTGDVTIMDNSADASLNSSYDNAGRLESLNR